MSVVRIIIDLEMTPIHKQKKIIPRVFTREIIEIGAVKVDEHNQIIDRFHCFVRPQYSKIIQQRITRLTGITMVNLLDAPVFRDALRMLSEWIGEGETEIYSWSSSDLLQISSECEAKDVPFPANMANWIDFQPVFAKKMGFEKKKSQIALRRAAELFGIDMDKGHAHSALYDAQVTAQLLIHVLNGDCAEQSRKLSTVMQEEEHLGVALGGACGGILGKLLKEMDDDPVVA